MAKKFPDKVARRALLWSARHCCVCGKQCGVHIELHHIDPDGPSDQDNCLPVCYECHGLLCHYDVRQPRGRKFRFDELKARRDQVFDTHTRHLVPPTHFVIAPDPRNLPFARFEGRNLEDYPPVRAMITLTFFMDGVSCGIADGEHYNGTTPVNLNPRHGFNGWFELPDRTLGYKHYLLVRVEVTIIDPYERAHELLPFGYMHMRDRGDGTPEWYYEPSPGLFERKRKGTKSARARTRKKE